MPDATGNMNVLEESQALVFKGYLQSGNVCKLMGTKLYLQQGRGGTKDDQDTEAACHVHSLVASVHSYYRILESWMQNLGCQ